MQIHKKKDQSFPFSLTEEGPQLSCFSGKKREHGQLSLHLLAKSWDSLCLNSNFKTFIGMHMVTNRIEFYCKQDGLCGKNMRLSGSGLSAFWLYEINNLSACEMFKKISKCKFKQKEYGRVWVLFIYLLLLGLFIYFLWGLSGIHNSILWARENRKVDKRLKIAL